METKKAIEERRSTRDFKTDDISKEVVEDILNCGRLAPSAKDRQPWYFVILKNEMKNKIADLMIEYIQSTDESEIYAKSKSPNTIKASANIIKQAPVLVLIFRPENDYWRVGDSISIGACVENMYLRATDLGIGIVCIRDTCFISNQISQMIGYQNFELNCAVALGIPNQKSIPKVKKELKDIIKWY